MTRNFVKSVKIVPLSSGSSKLNFYSFFIVAIVIFITNMKLQFAPSIGTMRNEEVEDSDAELMLMKDKGFKCLECCSYSTLWTSVLVTVLVTVHRAPILVTVHTEVHFTNVVQ